MNERLSRPLIHTFLEAPMSGPEIELKSFEIIDRETPAHPFPPNEWQIVRRMIHTTGDFSVSKTVRFSQDAVAAGIRALQSCRTIYTDANMIRSGISLNRLKGVCGSYRRENIICHVADADVENLAKGTGLPRSLLAIRKAKSHLEGAIVVIGNAPVALMELSRLIVEEGLHPSLVIAMPVGFVHVTESKEELMELEVPYIATMGRRGGSPLAVTVIHALCGLAIQEKDPGRSV